MKNRPVPSLAPTAWPRSGGDRRNSANFSFPGPDSAHVLWRIPLKDPPPGRGYFAAGCILAADNCLRVVHNGTLRSVNLAGRMLWKRSLRSRSRSINGHSLPLALDDGSIWLTSNGRLLTEQNGRLQPIALGRLGDDSAVSPNLGYDGSIYCGGFECASRWQDGTVTRLDEAGYDIFAPAVYDDGSVLLASYYGTGLCRRHPDGDLIYEITNGSRQQDGLVTVNEAGEAACRSLNDRHSVVVDLAGQLLWLYARPATFSSFRGEQGGWVALADDTIARLSRRGHVLWTRNARSGPGMGPRQAVIDSRDVIYAPTAEGLVAFSPQGHRLFATGFETGECSNLCPVAPGQMALIHSGILYFIGEVA